MHPAEKIVILRLTAVEFLALHTRLADNLKCRVHKGCPFDEDIARIHKRMTEMGPNHFLVSE